MEVEGALFVEMNAALAEQGQARQKEEKAEQTSDRGCTEHTATYQQIRFTVRRAFITHLLKVPFKACLEGLCSRTIIENRAW